MTTIPDPDDRGFRDLLVDPKDHSASVAKLRQLATRASTDIPDEFGYIFPAGTALTSIQRDAYTTKKSGAALSRIQSIGTTVAGVWETGAIAPKMRVFADLRLHAIADFLRPAADELEKGYLRSSFSLMRSALEITALVTYLENKLALMDFRSRLEAAPFETRAAYALLGEIDELLHLKSFQTKLNLEKIRTEGLLEPQEIKSERSDEILNLKPEHLIDTFKPLNARVQGSSHLYAFVCDFSHPNAILQFEYTEDDKQSEHVYSTREHKGIIIAQRRYSTRTRSAGLINSYGLAIKDALEIFGQCIEAALVARHKISKIADLVEPIARRYIHDIISTAPTAFPADMPCPCQSSSTVGKCSGAKAILPVASL